MNIKLKSVLLAGSVALLAAGCGSSVTTSNSTPSTMSNQPAGSQSTPATGNMKFSDQSYYKFAYQISGNNLSADAQKALTGFKMDQQTLADGSTQITLTALKAGYHDQQYILKTGQQLYFIEKFLGDDASDTHEDRTLGDDTAVVVDNEGNVVGQPQGWSTGQ